MKKQSDKTILYNLPPCKTGDKRPLLLRVFVAKEHTKVDFGYQTMRNYIKGGWVSIAKDTFIRVKATGEKFTMIRAESIPIAPKRHDFKTRKDWLYFSLYFPPIPHSTDLIEIIETEPGEPTDFNYTNVVLDSKKAIELL